MLLSIALILSIDNHKVVVALTPGNSYHTFICIDIALITQFMVCDITYSWKDFTLNPIMALFITIFYKIYCSRRSQTPNKKLLEGFYCSQIRQPMWRHKHIGSKRWHHNKNDEDVEHDGHNEHVDHGDAKNFILLCHKRPSWLPSQI